MKKINNALFIAILAATLFSCDDSGNNGTEGEDSSSSGLLSSSSQEENISSADNSSSSSTIWSSSSTEISSSSEDSPVTVIDGTITDPRDGIIYKVVVIGTQTWMAENLKYGEACLDWYEDCNVYGSLYSWTETDSLCPTGWHLPSETEWRILIHYVDDNNGNDDVGKSLKSASGWSKYDSTATGLDAFGFEALPAGACTNIRNCSTSGSRAWFWTSVGGIVDKSLFYTYDKMSYYVGINNTASDDEVTISYTTASHLLSVRCIQDSAE